MYTIIIDDQAKQDINEITVWYKEESGPELVERFLRQLDLAIGGVEEFPHSYPIHFRNFRRVLLSIFPYKIVFCEKEDAIHIIAVIHTSRHSSAWKKRI